LGRSAIGGKKLTGMSTIAQLNHTECPKLHTLITTKFKLLNNLNMANITKGI